MVTSPSTASWGRSGLFYWYSIGPLHQFIFAGVLRLIAGAARPGGSVEGDENIIRRTTTTEY